MSSLHIINGNTSLTLEFPKEKLTFTSIQVWYRSRLTGQELVDSSMKMGMTGFRLSWFLQDSRRTRLTEIKPDIPEDWQAANADIPRYQNQYFVSMVENAAQGRLQNVT